MELTVTEKKYAEKSVKETCEEYKGIYVYPWYMQKLALFVFSSHKIILNCV
jgi:hypothetical protein